MCLFFAYLFIIRETKITFCSGIFGMFGVLIISLSQSKSWFNVFLSSVHLIPTLSAKKKRHVINTLQVISCAKHHMLANSACFQVFLEIKSKMADLDFFCSREKTLSDTRNSLFVSIVLVLQ